MPEDFRSSLPPGEWIMFGSLPAETTAQSFAAWLREIGFEISDDRVSVKNHGSRCNAIVSFPHSEFAVILNWAINKQPYKGYQALAQPCARKDRPKFH